MRFLYVCKQIECVVLNACHTCALGHALRDRGVMHVVCWHREVIYAFFVLVRVCVCVYVCICVCVLPTCSPRNVCYNEYIQKQLHRQVRLRSK